jgi:hypothetical protein
MRRIWSRRRRIAALLPTISTSLVSADGDPTGADAGRGRLYEDGWEMDMASSYIGKMRLQVSL